MTCEINTIKNLVNMTYQECNKLFVEKCFSENLNTLRNFVLSEMEEDIDNNLNCSVQMKEIRNDIESVVEKIRDVKCRFQ